jgi:hypothetical protein
MKMKSQQDDENKSQQGGKNWPKQIVERKDQSCDIDHHKLTTKTPRFSQRVFRDPIKKASKNAKIPQPEPRDFFLIQIQEL